MAVCVCVCVSLELEWFQKNNWFGHWRNPSVLFFISSPLTQYFPFPSVSFVSECHFKYPPSGNVPSVLGPPFLNYSFFYIRSLLLSGWSCHPSSVSADPDVAAETCSCLGNVPVWACVQPSRQTGGTDVTWTPRHDRVKVHTGWVLLLSLSGSSERL